MRTHTGTGSWAPGQGICDEQEDQGEGSRITAVVAGLSGEPSDIANGLRHLCAITGVASAQGLPAAIQLRFSRNREEGARLARAVEQALSSTSVARLNFERLFSN